MARSFWQKIFAFVVLGGATALLVVLMATPIAWSQSAPNPSFNLQQAITPPLDEEDAVATGRVRLDGYDLFAIAAPALTRNSQQPNTTTPIQERINGIEETLSRIANSNFDPKTLQVTTEIDEQSNLPVISINGQYLMTVTTLDAHLQVQAPDRWAEHLTGLIRQALLRAQQERQPEFLAQQSLIAAGIVIAMLCSSFASNFLQKQLSRQRQVEQQELLNPVISQQPTNYESSSEAATALQQHHKRQHRNLRDVQRRLLKLIQVAIWVGGGFIILGLFPYTRWLRPVILSTPLKILGIWLGIYIFVRISDVLIERFSGALIQENFIDTPTSQRLALRVSTFSRVLRSGALVIWVVVGILASFSAVGVDLVPLLAGAGIIGLAISFAAQSLIKDMINGFLILFEDQYAVGDVIIVGEAAGLVENMNLRITQLRNSEGQLISIPNSTITVVRNLSKDWSRVDLTIDLAYGTHPDHALEIIRQLAAEMYETPEWHEKMLEPPEVLGIDEVDHTGILIRVWIKTLPLQQWVVAREFRRRLTLTLHQSGLAIGVPQQSLQLTQNRDLDRDLEKLAGQDGHH